MTVEINILSGQRQGERLVFNGTKIRAGTEPTCDLYFDPSADRAAKDRAVALSLLNDEWYVQSTGQGPVFVNQGPVVGLTRLTSGAVVRMSENGPDFEFRIVGGIATTGRQWGLNKPAGRSAATSIAPASIPPASSVPAMPSLPSLRPETPPPAVFSPPRPIRRFRGRPATIAGLGVLALVLMLLLLRLGSPPAEVPAPPLVTGSPGSDSQPEAGFQTAPARVVEKVDPAPSPSVSAKAMAAAPPSVSSEAMAAAPPSVSSEPPAAPPAIVPLPAESPGGVLLIQVEKAGRCWPFAVCSAIAENVALTSAREALQLGVWLNDPNSGFKGSVTHPATGLKLPIRGTRIYAVRLASPDQQKPKDWLYTNLGLVIVEGVFPKTVKLPGPEDWAQLAPGKPVHAFCYLHEGDVLTPEDRIESKVVPGKILFINAHPELPGKPRVLGIKADLPKFPQGSPLVNAQGTLVAVYAASVAEVEGQAQAGPGLENVHYATVIHPGVIDLWLKKSDGTAWISTAELGLPTSGRGAKSPR